MSLRPAPGCLLLTVLGGDFCVILTYFVLEVFYVVFCMLLLVFYRQAVLDQLPRLGKRELLNVSAFTCNYVVSVGEVSSSSGCLGWATLFYCDTP